MDLWLIYAILSALFAGLFAFTQKISAKKNHSSSHVAIYTYGTASLLVLLWLLLAYKAPEQPTEILIVAWIGAILYYFAISTRIHALRLIESTIYFPIYKTLGPIFATGIGYFYFRERLTVYEVIGVILGILVPLLLLTKQENLTQKNLTKGTLLVLLGGFLSAITAATSKYIVEHDLSFVYFLLFTYPLQLMIAITLFYYRKEEVAETESVKKVGILSGIFLFLATYCFLSALTANFAVVFTVNALSLLVPIVLSIILYKEHINFRKIFVIILSIASLVFFAL